jgi:hypothetical protein
LKIKQENEGNFVFVKTKKAVNFQTMALVQKPQSKDPMTCEGFTVKSLLKNAKV